MYAFLLICLVLPAHLFGFSLKEKLSAAKRGDYIVLASRKQLFFLLVLENSPSGIHIEEIIAPIDIALEYNNNWKKWIAAQAPQNTSWTKFLINPETKKETKGLLETILSLDVGQVATHSLKRIGPPPGKGEEDFRKFWQPKIMVNGIENHLETQAYSGRWPEDESDLSGRLVTIYLSTSPALEYFPYWIEISTVRGAEIIRVVDSGRNFIEPEAT